MQFSYAELRRKLVDHLIALEAMDPAYAVWALDQARREPSGLYRDLLADIKAEKARRTAVLPVATSSSKDGAETPTSPARPLCRHSIFTPRSPTQGATHDRESSV